MQRARRDLNLFPWEGKMDYLQRKAEMSFPQPPPSLHVGLRRKLGYKQCSMHHSLSPACSSRQPPTLLPKSYNPPDLLCLPLQDTPHSLASAAVWHTQSSLLGLTAALLCHPPPTVPTPLGAETTSQGPGTPRPEVASEQTPHCSEEPEAQSRKALPLHRP